MLHASSKHAGLNKADPPRSGVVCVFLCRPFLGVLERPDVITGICERRPLQLKVDGDLERVGREVVRGEPGREIQEQQCDLGLVLFNSDVQGALVAVERVLIPQHLVLWQPRGLVLIVAVRMVQVMQYREDALDVVLGAHLVKGVGGTGLGVHGEVGLLGDVGKNVVVVLNAALAVVPSDDSDVLGRGEDGVGHRGARCVCSQVVAA